MTALLAFARLVQLKCSPHPLPLSPSIDPPINRGSVLEHQSSSSINLSRASIDHIQSKKKKKEGFYSLKSSICYKSFEGFTACDGSASTIVLWWLSSDIEDNIQTGFQTQNYRQSSLTDQ
jgi:hypothetical protein